MIAGTANRAGLPVHQTAGKFAGDPVQALLAKIEPQAAQFVARLLGSAEIVAELLDLSVTTGQFHPGRVGALQLGEVSASAGCPRRCRRGRQEPHLEARPYRRLFLLPAPGCTNSLPQPGHRVFQHAESHLRRRQDIGEWLDSPHRNRVIAKGPAVTTRLNGVTLDASTHPRRPPASSGLVRLTTSHLQGAQCRGDSQGSTRGPQLGSGLGIRASRRVDSRLPTQRLTQPPPPAIKVDLLFQQGPLAVQFGVGLLRRHRRFGLPDGNIGLQRLDPGDVRALRHVGQPSHLRDTRRNAAGLLLECGHCTTKGAYLFAQPGLHGRESRRAEQLLQQLSALFGIAGEEAGEVTLRQQDDLEELARAHPQQALKVVIGFPHASGAGNPLAVDALAQHHLRLVAGHARAARLRPLLLGSSRDLEPAAGHCEVELHLGRDTGRGMVGAQPLRSVAFTGHLPVKGETDGVEQGGLACPRRAGKQEKARLPQPIEVDGLGPGERAKGVDPKAMDPHQLVTSASRAAAKPSANSPTSSWVAGVPRVWATKAAAISVSVFARSATA